MIEMTIASLGRSTKTAEIICSASADLGPGRTWCDRAGGNLDARPHTLQPLQDHRLALFHAAGDDGQRGGRLAELDRTPFDLVVGTDDINIIPALVGQDGGPRHPESGHR